MNVHNVNLFSKMALSIFLCVSGHIKATLITALERLKQAYPEHIQSVSEESITWTDGTSTPVQDGNSSKSMSEKLNEPSLADQVEQAAYLS
jgi:hypothetical protein